MARFFGYTPKQLIVHTPPPLLRRYPITEDYDVSPTVLGTGSNGQVLLCTSRKSRRQCALKILRRSNLASLQEVHLHIMAYRSDCIVKIEDVYDNMWYGIPSLLVVMEYMAGGTLRQRIQKQSLAEPQAAAIVKQIVRAVAHLHGMNVAHRDLKLENFLFENQSLDSPLKLTDFGFAEKVTSPNMLRGTCGTAYYIAPEILRGDKYDKSCDMWSLGVIIYMLICGRAPFYPSHGKMPTPSMGYRILHCQYPYPPELRDHISNEAKALISQLLKTHPAERLPVDSVLEHSWFRRTTDRTIRQPSTSSVLLEFIKMTQAWKSLGY